MDEKWKNAFAAIGPVRSGAWPSALQGCWAENKKTFNEDFVPVLEEQYLSKISDAHRTLNLDWKFVKKPSDWITSYVRSLTFGKYYKTKLDAKKVAHLTGSDIMTSLKRLTISEIPGLTKIEGFSALCSAPETSGLTHFGFQPGGMKNPTAEHGAVLAQSPMAETLESLTLAACADLIGGFLSADLSKFESLRELRFGMYFLERCAQPLAQSELLGRLTSVALGGSFLKFAKQVERKPILERLLFTGSVNELLELASIFDLSKVSDLTLTGPGDAYYAIKRLGLQLEHLTIEEYGHAGSVRRYIASGNADKLVTLRVKAGKGTLDDRFFHDLAASEVRLSELSLSRQRAVSTEGFEAFMDSPASKKLERMEIEGNGFDARVFPVLKQHRESFGSPRFLQLQVAGDEFAHPYGGDWNVVKRGRDLPAGHIKVAVSLWHCFDVMKRAEGGPLELDIANYTVSLASLASTSMTTVMADEDIQSESGVNCEALGKWPLDDLQGLQYATSLEMISVVNKMISCLEPIANLPKLRHLNLRDNKHVSDVEALATLPALEILDIVGTSVEDITPLLNVTTLKTLALGTELLKNANPATVAQFEKRGVKLSGF